MVLISYVCVEVKICLPQPAIHHFFFSDCGLLSYPPLMCGALSGKSSLKSGERGWKHKVAAQFLKHNLAGAAKLCFKS
ncbi:MAG: hypothetical protein AB7U82_12690, partial [Blastocatellales bacterium]